MHETRRIEELWRHCGRRKTSLLQLVVMYSNCQTMWNFVDAQELCAMVVFEHVRGERENNYLPAGLRWIGGTSMNKKFRAPVL